MKRKGQQKAVEDVEMQEEEEEISAFDDRYTST